MTQTSMTQETTHAVSYKQGSRLVIVIVLILSLLAAGITRRLALAQRENATTGNRPRAEVTGRTSLSSMSSFSLALLLGGLRGPLVMVLWSQSETQKQEKNLEGFDTRIEWIRLLQPEFDTVHIFQIWNKAYNISVQMASLANKYTTILDALEYAHNIDAERPDNINTLAAIGQVYFDKLGGSSEKQYYRKRVRAETQPHKSRQKLNRNDPAWRRLELDPMLDDQGMILPSLLATSHPRPTGSATTQPYNDGSELQYLAPYQPFKFGVSPLALAYNYYKRAQILQEVGKQKHAQLSDLVVDNRPALSLKTWGEEEWEHGRRMELTAYGKTIPNERIDLEKPTAAIDSGTEIKDRKSLDEAIFAYDRAARLAMDSLGEYERHLKNYTTNFDNYRSHMDQLRAQEALNRADRDYLKIAIVGPEKGDGREILTNNAAQAYVESIRGWCIMSLRYYLNEGDVFPQFMKAVPGFNREILDKLTTEQLAAMLNLYETMVHEMRPAGYTNEDRMEYQTYITRAANRLAKLGK